MQLLKNLPTKFYIRKNPPLCFCVRTSIRSWDQPTEWRFKPGELKQQLARCICNSVNRSNSAASSSLSFFNSATRDMKPDYSDGERGMRAQRESYTKDVFHSLSAERFNLNMKSGSRKTSRHWDKRANKIGCVHFPHRRRRQHPWAHPSRTPKSNIFMIFTHRAKVKNSSSALKISTLILRGGECSF
jgi:hypothetical protein